MQRLNIREDLARLAFDGQDVSRRMRDVLRYHDFSRFGLAGGEEVTYYAAFDMGMEAVFTPERFVYRDAHTGETWSLPFASMRQVRGRCSGYDVAMLGWERMIDIWLDSPLDPEDTEERGSIGDLNILAADVQQLFEIAARLSEAMVAARRD